MILRETFGCRSSCQSHRFHRGYTAELRVFARIRKRPSPMPTMQTSADRLLTTSVSQICPGEREKVAGERSCWFQAWSWLSSGRVMKTIDTSRDLASHAGLMPTRISPCESKCRSPQVESASSRALPFILRIANQCRAWAAFFDNPKCSHICSPQALHDHSGVQQAEARWNNDGSSDAIQDA